MALLSPKGHQEAVVLYHCLLQKEAVKTISLAKLSWKNRYLPARQATKAARPGPEGPGWNEGVFGNKSLGLPKIN
jgi:hypothetical protein